MDPSSPAARPVRGIVVADADPASRALLEEWLGADGWRVIDESHTADAAAGGIALAVVDVPRPRGGGDTTIRRVRAALPGVPVLAVSPGFLPNVQPCGACARLLGVQYVLPKPLVREDLLVAVRALAGAPG